MNDKFSAGSSPINRSFGLEQCGGDEQLYNWSLRRFSRDNARALIALKSAADSGDFEHARRLAHTLKGLAGSLGALELQAAARDAEAALLDKSLGEAQMRALERAFGAVLAEIEALPDDAPKGHQASDTVNPEKALLLLGELAPLLRKSNSLCFSYLPQIRETLSPIGSDCELLIAHIEDCNFPLALEILSDIRKLIT